MSANNIIGIPANDTEFEEKCVPLFASIARDPNFKRVATRGKNQQGIDLIGARDRDPHQPIGVQCKLKTKGDKLTEIEVRSDVGRALSIKPPLTEIYVVTTASDDLAYDTLALTLRGEQLALKRRVDIQIWGWDEMQRRIRRDPGALNAFDPDYSASTATLIDTTAQILEIGRESLTEISGVSDQTAQILQIVSSIAATSVGSDPGGRLAVDAVLNAQIDQIRDLLNQGRPRTALTMFDALEKRLTPQHSGAIRARVRANRGFAYLKLGDEARAGALLLEAYELDPEDPKIKANRLLGFALAGDPNRALEEAARLIAEDPSYEAAASIAYGAAEMGAAGDPDTFVPRDLWLAESVAPARIGALRRRENKAWWVAAAEAHARWPEDSHLARLAGEAILDEAIKQRGEQRTANAGAFSTRIEVAAGLLQQHWDEVRTYENAAEKSWLGVGLNLITAYRLLRDGERADSVAAQVLAVAPNDADALNAAAHVDLLQDRDDAAIAKMTRTPEGVGRTLVLLMAFGSKGDWPAIVDLATPERIAMIQGEDRQLADAMLLRARAETGVDTDLGREIEAVLARWPNSLNMLVTVTEVAQRHVPDLAPELLTRTLAALGPMTHPVERAMLAELALKSDDYETAILALDGHVATNQDTAPLRWLALAFANAATRPRTHTFFTSLAPDLLAQPRYARLAGAAEAARGDLHGAEEHLRRAIAGDPADLRAHMILHSVLMRDDRADEAAAVIRGFDETAAEGSPLELMRLASLLRHHHEDARALALGYQIASVNRNDREVVELYPNLIFFSEELPEEVRRSGTVAPGCWFDLEGEDVQDVSGIVQEGQTPEVSSYAPDHPLARAVLGRSPGDEVILSQNFGPDRRYRVREVKHRSIWLLQDITRSHATRFPESTSMGEMTMKDDNIGPVLDFARRTSEQGLSILAAYSKLAVPLEVLAELHHRSVLSIAELIPQLGGEIRTCLGSEEERQEAMIRAAKSKGLGAALDTLTVWCAHHLELLPALAKHFGYLAVAQSTLDQLIKLRERERSNLGREYMTLGFEGDQAVRQIHTPEDTQRRIEMIEGAIAAVRAHCRILPVDGTDDHELNRFVHRETIRTMLDPVLLARQHNLYLLSDDLHLRQISGSYGGHRSGWLQAVTQLLRDHGDLPSAVYARSVGHFAARKHGHVSLDGGTLFDLATLGQSEATALFEFASDYIGGPRAEIVSHSAAVADFCARVWVTDLPSWQQGRFCGILITKLLRGRMLQWREVLGIVQTMLRYMPFSAERRTDLARQYLTDWIRGHFLFDEKPRAKRRRSRRRAD